MSKTPTKIVQKKKKEKKPWNTEIQRLEKKKRCSKLCLQMQRNTKFQETKICLAVYTKKKPNKNLAVIYINTGYWGVFTNELSRKEKKKKRKKNAKPRIIQIWCSREIIRNKKTREKKKWNKKEKKKTVSRKKRYTNLCLQKPKVLRNTSVKKHKCQET